VKAEEQRRTVGERQEWKKTISPKMTVGMYSGTAEGRGEETENTGVAVKQQCWGERMQGDNTRL